MAYMLNRTLVPSATSPIHFATLVFKCANVAAHSIHVGACRHIWPRLAVRGISNTVAPFLEGCTVGSFGAPFFGTTLAGFDVEHGLLLYARFSNEDPATSGLESKRILRAEGVFS